jgi:hypothetical protein
MDTKPILYQKEKIKTSKLKDQGNKEKFSELLKTVLLKKGNTKWHNIR